MTKPRPPILQGLDTLLQDQALEFATLRAARSDRHAMEWKAIELLGGIGPVPEHHDDMAPIDVADRGAENLRERDTCLHVDLARDRVHQLTPDTAFFRGPATPDGGEPRT